MMVIEYSAEDLASTSEGSGAIAASGLPSSEFSSFLELLSNDWVLCLICLCSLDE